MAFVGRSTDAESAERRRTPRIGVELWVQEQCDAGVYFHRMTNLSPEGFFVEKKIPFRSGQVVTIRWQLPGAGPQLEARSRVVANYRDRQANLMGAGFQFLDLSPQARRRIEALVKQTASPNEDPALRRSEDDPDQGTAESR